jgi:hypothetical protein
MFTSSPHRKSSFRPGPRTSSERDSDAVLILSIDATMPLRSHVALLKIELLKLEGRAIFARSQEVVRRRDDQVDSIGPASLNLMCRFPTLASRSDEKHEIYSEPTHATHLLASCDRLLLSSNSDYERAHFAAGPLSAPSPVPNRSLRTVTDRD